MPGLPYLAHLARQVDHPRFTQESRAIGQGAGAQLHNHAHGGDLSEEERGSQALDETPSNWLFANGKLNSANEGGVIPPTDLLKPEMYENAPEIFGIFFDAMVLFADMGLI